jgi:Fe-S-cluster containining protein
MNLQAQKKIIKKLRKMIPAVTCPDGCHNCCTGTAFIEGIEMSEWESKQILRANISFPNPKDNSMDADCLFLEDSKCIIYELRPITCRIYGALQMCNDESDNKFCSAIPERTVTDNEKMMILKIYAQVYPHGQGVVRKENGLLNSLKNKLY